MVGVKKLGFRDWENFGEYILNNVLDHIDYWAWNISGDTALEAYSSYNNIDFYEAALDFANEIEIELLEKMPREIYEKINVEYHRKLERVISELEKEYGEYLLE